MSTIQIHRSSEWVNRLRAIKIFLDDKEIGEIGHAESKSFEIPAGTHTLQAKIDWCKSNLYPFMIEEDWKMEFDLCSFAKNNSFGSFATIYYITFGKNKFLRLTERKQTTL